MRRQASGVKNGARLDEFEPSLPADGRRFADRINGQAEHGTRTMPMTPPTALMGLLKIDVYGRFRRTEARRLAEKHIARPSESGFCRALTTRTGDFGDGSPRLLECDSFAPPDKKIPSGSAWRLPISNRGSSGNRVGNVGSC